MTRYARRTDANHIDVKRVFERTGEVWDCSQYGGGITDLMVVLFDSLLFVEIKDGEKAPSARKLTKKEQEFRDFCERGGIPYHVVASVDEAEALVESVRQSLNEDNEQQEIQWMQ